MKKRKNSPYPTIGNLTFKQFDALDSLMHRGPMELPEIAKSIFPDSLVSSARRMLHRWRVLGIIDVVGKTEGVKSDHIGTTGVSSNRINLMDFKPSNI